MAIEKIWTHEGPSAKKEGKNNKSWTHEGPRKKR
jgi:hypothetical protein